MLQTDLINLTVSDIIRETADTISIRFAERNGKERLSYKPGQFITLVFNLSGRELRRSYSISSFYPSDPFLQITVKRIMNGEISRYLFENVKKGDTLIALPPNGRFIINDSSSKIPRDFFMITAGSGITPVYPLIRSILMNEERSRITLIYANRKEETSIFYSELKELEKSSAGKLKCIFLFSELSEHKKALTGHLQNDLLEKLIHENLHYKKEHAEFYLCGPYTFMRMANITIIAMAFDESNIHRENFVPAPTSDPLASIPHIENNSEKNVSIHYPGGSVQLIVPPRTTILDEALKNGIKLPYSCRTGICGSCAARCLNGEVLMSNNQVLTTRDLQSGWVLTCTGYPSTGNVELEFK